MSDEAQTIEVLSREKSALERELAELRGRFASRLAPPSQTELELRLQEQWLRLILDGVRDHAISMLDPEGRVELFNAPAERIKGYSLAEVQGQYFGMFFTPEDRAAGLPETELQTARTKGRYEGEGWRQRKDGSRFYAAVSLSALHAPSGELVGFVKVTQDRTHYRELSQALGRREAELSLVLDAIPGLVTYVAPDHTYRFVNRAHEAWFHHPPREIQGRHLADVIGDRAYALIRPHLEAALSGRFTSFEAEVPYKDAGTRWVHASCIPDRDAAGAIRGCIMLVLDQTDARNATEHLAEEARANETIYRIGTALTADTDLDTIFARLTDEATALCRAEFGAFFYNVQKPEGGSYMLYTLSGVAREKFAGFPMPRNTAIFAPTFEGTGVVRSDDITKDPRYGRNPPYRGMPEGHLPVRSYLAVPVYSRSGEVHGGLFFGHSGAGVFTERDERMLVAIAVHATVAIDNARLHAATQAAEEKYRVLTEASPQLVWTTTVTGEVEYCNQQFLSFVGLPLEVMQRGTVWRQILHPEDVERASAAWAKAIATGEPYEVEYRFRRALDGSYRWFLA